MTWQPIETAPRNDADILLYCAKFTPEIGNDYGPGICIGHSYGRGGWSVTHTDYYSVDITPTHWMPLPEPPSPTDRGGM